MNAVLNARFIQVIAKVVFAKCVWDTPTKCTNDGKFHHATVELERLEATASTFSSEMKPPKYGDPTFPKKCDDCGAVVPENVEAFLGMGRVYNTDSGNPEPGDLYFTNWYSCAKEGKCIHGWTNCDGNHLFAVLPDGTIWDIDSRCNNCTLPDENTHRCWVRHGTPPDIHVDKNGHTCRAGAGSISVPKWHGFLHNGKFTRC